jgi:hypothetical protein
VCYERGRLAIRWRLPSPPHDAFEEARRPPVTVTTSRAGNLVCGAYFGGMSHPPLDESAREAGSKPITGQPSNSFPGLSVHTTVSLLFSFVFGLSPPALGRQ